MTSPDRFGFTPEERQRLERIERLVADGAAGVAPLIDLLDDPSWTVRRAVVAGLAAGGSAVVAPLCRALRDRRDNEARIAATVDALAALDAEVDATLTAMASNPDPAIVADVAQILGRRRSRDALPTLAALIHHQDDNVAVAAIEALGRVGGRAAVDSLVEAVRSGNFFRIFPAIDVLGRSGDPRAVAPLTALLDEPQYAAEAARALGRTGDRAAVAPLMALVGRGAGAIVRVAALALNELRQRNAEHFGSGERIEEAITEARGAGTVRQLVRALSDGETSEKAALCFVLAVLRDVSTAPALTALLDGPVEVVEAASNALKRIGPEANAQILLEIRSGGVKRALLPLVSHTMAEADVVACLVNPNPDVRSLACEALGRMGATGAAAALFPLLADPNPRVAFAALGAIQSLGGRETERLTLAALRSPEARCAPRGGAHPGLLRLRGRPGADPRRARRSGRAGPRGGDPRAAILREPSRPRGADGRRQGSRRPNARGRHARARSMRWRPAGERLPPARARGSRSLDPLLCLPGARKIGLRTCGRGDRPAARRPGRTGAGGRRRGARPSEGRAGVARARGGRLRSRA